MIKSMCTDRLIYLPTGKDEDLFRFSTFSLFHSHASFVKKKNKKQKNASLSFPAVSHRMNYTT